MQSKITVSNLIMGIGGLVTLIFSFLAFIKYGGDGRNAWSSDAFAFASTVPAILALIMVIWIVLELAGVSLPEQVLTFNGDQMKTTWGIGAFGIMLSWISVDFGGADKGAGFWLMFIGSLAMAIGAVMALLGKGTDTVDIPGVAGSASGSSSDSSSESD